MKASSVDNTSSGDWFNNTTLQHLPDSMDFVFCATNLGTGSVVRFSKRYMADYRVGQRRSPNLPLSQVVAASAAFRPMLSPMRIKLGDDKALTEPFCDNDPGASEARPALADTAHTHNLELSDGRVYDNLGLQPSTSTRRFVDCLLAPDLDAACADRRAQAEVAHQLRLLPV